MSVDAKIPTQLQCLLEKLDSYGKEGSETEAIIGRLKIGCDILGFYITIRCKEDDHDTLLYSRKGYGKWYPLRGYALTQRDGKRTHPGLGMEQKIWDRLINARRELQELWKELSSAKKLIKERK